MKNLSLSTLFFSNLKSHKIRINNIFLLALSKKSCTFAPVIRSVGQKTVAHRCKTGGHIYQAFAVFEVTFISRQFETSFRKYSELLALSVGYSAYIGRCGSRDPKVPIYIHDRIVHIFLLCLIFNIILTIKSCARHVLGIML